MLSRDVVGEEKLIQDYEKQFGWCLEPLLAHLFPWAEASIDFDHYFWRKDGDTLKDDRSKLGPYEDYGEIESWRLELVLNDLGRAFLKVSEYLESESDLMTEIHTCE